jgi:hypothetical protein
MSHVFACAAPAHPAWHRHEPAASTASQRGAMPACNGADDATRDAAFVALQAAYRGHGGIASGDSLAARLDRAGRGGYLDLARRIVAGDLFSFRWNDAFWVPLFQFDPVLLTLRAARSTAGPSRTGMCAPTTTCTGNARWTCSIPS